MTENMDLTQYNPDGTTKSITLTNVTLGMDPYVLIELRPASDGSGEPALFIKTGGGAEEEPTALPILYLTSLPAEQNPITEQLVKLRNEYRIADDQHTATALEVLDRVAQALSMPLPEES